MNKILSIFDFQKQFPTEEDCYDYLKKIRWPDGFKCPQCSHTHAYEIATRKLFQCKKCRFQCSVTSGTVFHKLRQPFLKLFWAVYLVSTSKKSISATELQRKLSISNYNTAWLLLHRIRSSMHAINNGLLSDSEVDETYVGGSAKGKQGRGAKNKTIVAVAVETNGENIGKAALHRIDSVAKSNIKQFIKEHIAYGSKVTTDGFKSYFWVKDDYCHIIQKRDLKTDQPQALEKVHIVIANLKMWLVGIFNRYPTKHIQRYLDEFIFRFNLRFQLENIFNILLKFCVRQKAISFAELTK